MPLTVGTTDEYLLSLAHAAELNFVADATRFPASPAEAIDVERPMRFGKLFYDLTQQRRLTADRYNSNTFLFWSEPTDDDLVQIGRHILEDAQKRNIDAAEPMNPGRINALLTDYFQRVHKWLGPNYDTAITVPVPDLPPRIRRLVLDAAYHEISKTDTHTRLWFGDGLWKRARLKLLPQAPGAPVRDQAASLWVFTQPEGNASVGETYSYREARCVGMPPLQQVWRHDSLDHAKIAADFDAEQTMRRPEVLTTPEHVSPAPAPAADARLRTADLQQEPALAHLVSMEGLRLGVNTLFSALQVQSSVQLSSAPGWPVGELQDMRVTARVHAMPLWQFMDVLSDLFGVEWTKQDGSRYVMHPDSQGVLHTEMLRMGNLLCFRCRENPPVGFSTVDRDRANNSYLALAREMMEASDRQALDSPDGFSVARLPDAAQHKLRRHFEVMLTRMQLISGYAMVNKWLDQDFELYFGGRATPPHPPGAPADGRILRPHLVLRTPDHKFQIRILRDFPEPVIEEPIVVPKHNGPGL